MRRIRFATRGIMTVVVVSAIGCSVILQLAGGEVESGVLQLLAIALILAAALRVSRRRLLAAAAAITIASGGYLGAKWLCQRGSSALNLAAWHAQQAASYTNLSKRYAALAKATRDGTRPVRPMVPPDDPTELDDTIRRLVELEASGLEKRSAEQRELAAEHARFSRWYRGAAFRPWQSLEVGPVAP